MSAPGISLQSMDTEPHAVDCDCEPCEEIADQELLARLWPDEGPGARRDDVEAHLVNE